MKETIFFAVFESNTSQGQITADRVGYFSDKQSLKNFFDWLDSERKKLESDYSRNFVIKNTNFIKQGY